MYYPFFDLLFCCLFEWRRDIWHEDNVAASWCKLLIEKKFKTVNKNGIIPSFITSVVPSAFVFVYIVHTCLYGMMMAWFWTIHRMKYVTWSISNYIYSCIRRWTLRLHKKAQTKIRIKQQIPILYTHRPFPLFLKWLSIGCSYLLFCCYFQVLAHILVFFLASVV